jgi:hypothetical protein
MKRMLSISMGLAILFAAQQALAFGMAGSPQVGGIGGVRVGAIQVRASGVAIPAGAVSLHGITVLPNGTFVVPAVIPRIHGMAPSVNPGRIDPVQPCQLSGCGGGGP